MTDSTWEIVAATGHRPQHLSVRERDWVRATLPRVAERLRDEYGTRTAVSGFALGTDLWWADAAKRASLRLWPHIPFPQQPDVWPDPRDVAEWQRLRAAADVEPVIYGLHYDVNLLGRRNEGMLDVSGAVVAVHKPSKKSGGTYGALKEARRRKMPIVHLDPERELIIWPDPPSPSHWHSSAIQPTLFGEQR